MAIVNWLLPQSYYCGINNSSVVVVQYMHSAFRYDAAFRYYAYSKSNVLNLAGNLVPEVFCGTHLA